MEKMTFKRLVDNLLRCRLVQCGIEEADADSFCTILSGDNIAYFPRVVANPAEAVQKIRILAQRLVQADEK